MQRSHYLETGATSADRIARRAHIDACYEQGICYLCECPVVDGDALHGPTGAHWECANPPAERADMFEDGHAHLCGEIAQTRAQTQPRMARANGGYLVHFVIPATNRSLCGHIPRDRAHHMRQRGKWLYWAHDAVLPTHLKHCEKCRTLAESKYPPVDNQNA